MPLGQTTRMRQWVVLLPHPAPSSIIPTTPHLARSSAMMVVAMPVSDASSKASLNHNDQDATPHGGASCCDSVVGDLHWYPGVSLSPVTFCCVLSVQQNRGERIIDAVLRLRLQGASRRRAIVPSRQRDYHCGPAGMKRYRKPRSRASTRKLQRCAKTSRLNCGMSTSPQGAGSTPVTCHNRTHAPQQDWNAQRQRGAVQRIRAGGKSLPARTIRRRPTLPCLGHTVIDPGSLPGRPARCGAD